jgi:hypothetical protein
VIASETTRKNGRKLIVIVLDKPALDRMQFGEPVEMRDQFESADMMICYEEHADILADRFPKADDLVKHLRHGVVRTPKI